jgi:triosephosphate isomerase
MKALVVANWKMNPASLNEAKALFAETKHLTSLYKDLTVIVAPPVIFLRTLSEGVRKGRLSMAAQNGHFEDSGAHTGEISMVQIRDAKAEAVIIGHAERRAAGESDDDVRRKVNAALSSGLMPIICVGEKSRNGTEHFSIVREQVQTALADVPAAKLPKIIIAYEPVWAIGAKEAMKPRDMHEMAIFIRKTVVEKLGEAGHNIKVLYGGSVDGSNAAAMLREAEVKGFLVGRASVDADAFAALLRAVSAA